jgi:hypothetical protein
MDRLRLVVIRAALVALAWAGLCVDRTEAGVIPATNPNLTLRVDAGTGLPLTGEPTVSLYQLDDSLPSTVTLTSPSRCTRIGTVGLYRDVTDCWLPELNVPVFVVINGAPTNATVTLVAPRAVAPNTFPLASTAPNPFLTPSPTTSAYPGQCTNVGSGTGPDFAAVDLGPSLSPTSLSTPTGEVTAWGLMPQDCGGMAVIQVTSVTSGTFTFIVPRSGSATAPANGIPEIWKNLYSGIGNPSSDSDTGPSAASPAGDGISTIDEWRGFIASTRQIRTNPLLKNIFLRLVNAQCPTATSAAPGLLIGPAGGYPKPINPTASATLTLPGTQGQISGTFTASAAVFTSANTLGEIAETAPGGGRARISAVTSPTTVTAQITQPFSSNTLSAGAWQLSDSLFANVFGLMSPERVHLLGYQPDVLTGNLPTTSEWVDNFQSFVENNPPGLPQGVQYRTGTDGATSDRVVNANRIYGPPQKGIRVIECLDDGSTSPYGWAPGGSGSPNTIGNVVIYTRRILNQINLLINNGAPRNVQYSPMLTYDSRAKDWLPKTLVGAPSAAGVLVASKAMLFYVGHEIGHAIALNVTAASNPHFPSGSGDSLDQGITVKVDNKTSGFNTFYIPMIYGTSDQTQLLIK